MPIVIDIWPRDNETACYADMTRTFVVGEVPDEVARMAPPLQGGARPRGRARSATARPAAASSTARARSSRRPANRPSARRSRARRSRTASSTGSGTASGSRCTSSRGSGSRRRGARRRRRRHRRAGPLPAGYGGVRLEDLVLVTDERRREPDATYPYDAAERREARRDRRCAMRPIGQAIDTLLLEERRYPPPPEFAAQANAQAGRSTSEGFEAFWEREGRERVELVRAVHAALRVGAPVREVVPRRQAQRLATTASTATSRRGAATRSRSTGRASRRATGATSRTPTCSARWSRSRTR